MALERGGRHLADTKNPKGSDTMIIISSNGNHQVDKVFICHFMKIVSSLCVNLFNCRDELHPP